MKVRFLTLTTVALVFFASFASAAEKKDIVDTAVAAGSFKTLAAALDAADLVGALKGDGPFTVFAPTDEAFAKLPEGAVANLLKPENKSQLAAILTYHVVPGNVAAKQVVSLKSAKTLNGQQVDIRVKAGQVSIDKANVVATDIACSNGTIHVIDQVMMPSQDNIPATAAKAGSFKTLLAAAKAAGLVDALSSKGPLTVFAPTDDAFAKLPAGTVESLLKPENKGQLAAILKYHVVAGRVFSGEALKAGTAKTLQGQSVSITAKSGVAKVNDAKLVTLDIDASNGVIHVIDSVLLPPAAPKKIGAAEARRMIEHAVARGSHLYNSGHHSACAELYMETSRKMVSYGEQMPPLVMTSLQSALSKCSDTECATQQSWTLRHALDRAYVAMQDH